MEVTSLVTLADKYGTGIIFSVIVAILFYRLGMALINILNAKFLTTEPQKKTPNQLNNLIQHELSVNVGVNDILNSIRNDYDSCRVCVMQYHNGGYFNSGSHKTKISMTHEVVKTGVGNIAKDMQDIPSAIFTHVNSRLLTGESTTIIYDTDTGDGNSDEGVVATYKSVGYKSVYAFAIRKHNYLVAKVVVGYLTKHVLKEEDINDILIRVKQVETLINL